MKVVLAIISIPLLLGLAINTFAAERPATLVLIHGRIHTQDARRSIAQAMALNGNSIIAVGPDEDMRKFSDPGTRIIDLGGRVVIPGVIDAHIHPADGARDLDTCSLRNVPISQAELRAGVAKCVKENPGDRRQWFRVIKVDPTGLSLTLGDLDSMLSDRPMVMFDSSGHTAWVNSATLAAAHISAATKDPVGGHIERDASGNPTGTLQDAAFDIVQRAMPKPDLDLQAAQLERAFAAMHARGITSVQDASVDDDLMQIYKRLYDTHRLTMRVRASYRLENLDARAKTIIGRAIKFREKWAIDPNFLRADAVKIYADGVIEYPTQTAALIEPYLDAEGHATTNLGPSYFKQQNLNQIVAAADAAGFTVHFHAIGNRAVRSALDAFAYSRTHNGRLDNRDQIAHLELVDPADFPRFKALGVIANFQLDWAERDDFIVKGTLPYIGAERARYLYPARSLRDAGALIAGGSDWGDSFDAFEAMEHAVTRSGGRDQKPLLPEQSIAIQDIVDAYTINAAFALKQEHTTGSLEPGKRGDFIVLDRDIFAIDPFEIHETKVLATYLDGRQVYAANNDQASTSEKRLADDRGAPDSKPYALYLKGRSSWSKRTLPDLEAAVSYFTQAIAKDPGYALAYSGLADSYAIMPEYGGNPREAVPKAIAAARKALELDATLARPHAVLGHIKYVHDWDLAGGEAELKKAIELDPNDATTRQWYAESLFWLGGREEEALAEITRARQLDPRSLIIWRDFGADHIFVRRYDEAIAICKKLAEENPKFSTAYSCIAEAYWRKRRYSQAIKEYRVESQISGDRDESDYVSAMEKGFRTGGWRGALERGIEVLKEQRKTGYSSAYGIAASYAELGDSERAFEWLNIAYQEHDEWLLSLRTERSFDPIRSDPRFAELMRKVGLPQ